MTLLVRKRRLFRPCLAATRAVAVATIAFASGCASVPTSGTFIRIQPAEGARWISAETMHGYSCEVGALVCSADGGRLSERQCRCGPAR
jgi:hypothetical protein